MKILLNAVQEDHGLIKPFVKTYMAPYFSNFLSLLIKTDITECVAYILKKNNIISQLMQHTLAVEELYHKIMK